jgi:DNA-binding transcriptional regulator YhcF (GntR family)
MNFIFDNDRPIYIQLVEQLKLYIVSEKLELGSRLPSVRDFALQTKVNPNTLQKALSELEDENLIYTERTNGKFITQDKKLIEKVKKELANEKVQTYLLDMKKLGISKEEAIKYLQDLGGAE